MRSGLDVGETQQCQVCHRFVPTLNLQLHLSRCQRNMTVRRLPPPSNVPLEPLNSERIQQPVQRRERPVEGVSLNERRRKRSKILKEKPRSPELGEEVPELIACENCGYEQTLLELDTHPGQCPNKLSMCRGCSEKYPKNLLADHQDVCQASLLQGRHRPRDRPPRRNYRQMDRQRDSQMERHLGRGMGGQMERRVHIIMGRQMDSQRDRDVHWERRRHIFGANQGPSTRRREYPWRLHSEESDDGFPHLISRVSRGFGDHFEMLGRLVLISLGERGMEGEGKKKGLSDRQLLNIERVNYIQQEQEPELCTICYNNFTENETIMRLGCNHLFHIQCVGEWLKMNELCPICKQAAGNPEQEDQLY